MSPAALIEAGGGGGGADTFEFDDIDSLLAGPAGSSPAGAPPAGTPTPPVQQQVAPAGTPPPTGTPPPPDPLAEMRQAVEQANGRAAAVETMMQGLVARLTAGGAGAPQGQPQQEQSPYNLEVPAATLGPLTAALRSEDPAEVGKAISYIGNGIANIVHQTVLGQVQQMMRQIVPAQIETASQRTKIFNDFYGKYPRLAHPNLYPLVHAAAVKLGRSGKFNQWGDDMRDAVAKEVVETLRAVGGRRQPPTSGGTPPAGPGPQTPHAPGPNGTGVDPNSPDAIFNLIRG